MNYRLVVPLGLALVLAIYFGTRPPGEFGDTLDVEIVIEQPKQMIVGLFDFKKTLKLRDNNGQKYEARRYNVNVIDQKDCGNLGRACPKLDDREPDPWEGSQFRQVNFSYQLMHNHPSHEQDDQVFNGAIKVYYQLYTKNWGLLHLSTDRAAERAYKKNLGMR